jgi:3-oxoacyl-(acyl-carrier-protein) synthase
MAFNALLLGNTGRAVNSGANLMLSEVVSVAFKKSGMLAADGRCKTLDAAADGYVRAEASGSMLLEPMQPRAVRQQQARLQALLAGSAVNQDGRSSGLTAPNGPAQQEVIRASLKSGGLAASSVSVVQMHGTGTGLGDPIEVGALAAVMVGAAAGGALALVAGKSLIGHSEPAAGVMGLAHAHLAVASRVTLPILHLHRGKLLCCVDCSAVLHAPLPMSCHCACRYMQSMITSARRCSRVKAGGPCRASLACYPCTLWSAVSARSPSRAPMPTHCWLLLRLAAASAVQ